MANKSGIYLEESQMKIKQRSHLGLKKTSLIVITDDNQPTPMISS